jgi:hypothetical protein
MSPHRPGARVARLLSDGCVHSTAARVPAGPETEGAAPILRTWCEVRIWARVRTPEVRGSGSEKAAHSSALTGRAASPAANCKCEPRPSGAHPACAPRFAGLQTKKAGNSAAFPADRRARLRTRRQAGLRTRPPARAPEVRTPEMQISRQTGGFAASGPNLKCELRTRIRGLSVGLYRAVAPGIVFAKEGPIGFMYLPICLTAS